MEIKLCPSFYYRYNGEGETELNKKFNTDNANIVRNNSDLARYSGEWLKIHALDYVPYIVKPTDDLKKVASKFNISVQKLILDNNLKTEKLFIGQRLKIKE